MFKKIKNGGEEKATIDKTIPTMYKIVCITDY